ncbi:hypothetical protein [Erythrobacter sp.]|uniref:hypothetical protein n=1 Tax=Erythrobacter sp. TaxID=1042 RepID=UPI002EA3CDA5|nr:hypothetical protein [Erythrobacter sp.]
MQVAAVDAVAQRVRKPGKRGGADQRGGRNARLELLGLTLELDALESEGRRREVIGKQDEIFAAAAI